LRVVATEPEIGLVYEAMKRPRKGIDVGARDSANSRGVFRLRGMVAITGRFARHIQYFY
jgi:hypothetical protein